MQWLQERLDLGTYKSYKIDDIVLLVSEEASHWVRLSSIMAKRLKQYEGKTFKDIYREFSIQRDVNEKEVLRLLYRIASIGKGKIKVEPPSKDVFFVITRRCNLKCITCYIQDNKQKETEELTLTEIKVLFQRLKAEGFNLITISGGEPLLRKDLKEVIVSANQAFDGVKLNTNGTLIDREMGIFLKEQKVGIMISLDGVEQEANDRIRGEGTYVRILEAIRLLKKIGHEKIVVSTTVTGLNVGEVSLIYELCRQLGVEVTYGIFLESGRGRCNRETLSVPTSGLIRGYTDMLKLEIASCQPQRLIPPFLTRTKTHCGAVRSTVNIMPNGDVFPCPNLIEPEWKIGNLKGRTLRQLIADNEIVHKVAAREVKNVPRCKNCSIRYICGGGCMANAFLNSGHIYAVDPMCEFYKTLYSSFLSGWNVSRTDRENIEDIIGKMHGYCHEE